MQEGWVTSGVYCHMSPFTTVVEDTIKEGWNCTSFEGDAFVDVTEITRG